jgi:hypothetical protein
VLPAIRRGQPGVETGKGGDVVARDSIPSQIRYQSARLLGWLAIAALMIAACNGGKGY